MGKHINKDTKDLILNDIKQNGLKVAEAATKYACSTKAIYRWLGETADGASTLELAKLRRENQQLKEIIGMFVLDSEKSKKNR